LLVRDCAGGVCFLKDRVFLLKNEKNDWVLPKGRIRDGKPASEVAIERLKAEGNIDATIVLSAGETSYEFYSQTRKTPVYNKICWYIMTTDQDSFTLNPALQYTDGGFFPVYEGMEKATYSQDKGLISYAYRKYTNMMES
jgi:8-oxo-dGTP pyrophosphatase MutT (NUDIX family)